MSSPQFPPRLSPIQHQASVPPKVDRESLKAALNLHAVIPPLDQIHKATLSFSLDLARGNTTTETKREDHNDLAHAIFSGAICGAIQYGLNKSQNEEDDCRRSYLNGQADVREEARKVLESGDWSAIVNHCHQESLTSLMELASACKGCNFDHALIVSLENGHEIAGIDMPTAVRNTAFFVLANPPVAIRDLAQAPTRQLFGWEFPPAEKAA